MKNDRMTAAAAESAARQAAREKQRQRLREAQAKANASSKYHNRKTTRVVDGKRVLFDSQREARRWDELVLLQRAGKISDLERQVRYRLIPAQYGPDGRRTDAYVIKRKLMLRAFGIRVVEV